MPNIAKIFSIIDGEGHNFQLIHDFYDPIDPAVAGDMHFSTKIRVTSSNEFKIRSLWKAAKISFVCNNPPVSEEGIESQRFIGDLEIRYKGSDLYNISRHNGNIQFIMPTILIFKNFEIDPSFYTTNGHHIHRITVSNEPRASRLRKFFLFLRGTKLRIPHTSPEIPFVLKNIAESSTSGIDLELLFGYTIESPSSDLNQKIRERPDFVPHPFLHFFSYIIRHHDSVFAGSPSGVGSFRHFVGNSKRSKSIRFFPGNYVPEVGKLENCFPTNLRTISNSFDWSSYHVIFDILFDPLSRRYPLSYNGTIHLPSDVSSIQLYRGSTLISGHVFGGNQVFGSRHTSITFSATINLVDQENKNVAIPYQHVLPWLSRWIEYHRDTYNKNNLTRTNFYHKFWLDNPEIPWSLLACFTSRNAGYQMTDLGRYKNILSDDTYLQTISTALITGNLTLAVLQVIISNVIQMYLPSLFMFLESANFLIFRDVCPQLLAYERMKRLSNNYQSSGAPQLDAELRAIGEELKEKFIVEDYVVDKWIMFVNTGRDNSFWQSSSNIEEITEIKEMNLLLIINEQAFIERRLVNPAGRRRDYINGGPGARRIATLAMNLAGSLELTKLVYPHNISNSNRLFIFTVSDFFTINSRINTGRDLYAGLFLNSIHREAFKNWARNAATTNAWHDGSRVSYDNIKFSKNGNLVTEPFLSQDYDQVWPVDPRQDQDSPFRHIYRIPLVKESWSEGRDAQLSEGDIRNFFINGSDRFLSPPPMVDAQRNVEETLSIDALISILRRLIPSLPID